MSGPQSWTLLPPSRKRRCRCKRYLVAGDELAEGSHTNIRLLAFRSAITLSPSDILGSSLDDALQAAERGAGARDTWSLEMSLQKAATRVAAATRTSASPSLRRATKDGKSSCCVLEGPRDSDSRGSCWATLYRTRQDLSCRVHLVERTSTLDRTYMAASDEAETGHIRWQGTS